MLASERPLLTHLMAILPKLGAVIDQLLEVLVACGTSGMVQEHALGLSQLGREY